MKRRDWKRVSDCNRQLVFIKNAFPGQIAERAAINSETVGLAYFSKISFVSVLFLFKRQGIDIGGRRIAKHQRCVAGIQPKP
jgi:hypothetical protein